MNEVYIFKFLQQVDDLQGEAATPQEIRISWQIAYNFNTILPWLH